MTTFFICLIISVALAFGMSVALVEKGREWPMRRYNTCLRALLRKYVHRKAQRVLKCVTCTSFWMALISDIIVYVVSGFSYFFWPCSGFIVVGITYFLFEFLRIIDSSYNDM